MTFFSTIGGLTEVNVVKAKLPRWGADRKPMRKSECLEATLEKGAKH